MLVSSSREAASMCFSRTQLAVNRRHRASTLSLEPSSATLGWMHMFLRLLRPSAMISEALPTCFSRYACSTRSSASTFSISGTVRVQ